MGIVDTNGLTRRFGDLIAVNKLNLTVNSGEVFGLLGPNGAGKSTVIKMLTTLLRPTDGDAVIGGFNIVRQAGDVRRIIGYVPQAISADGTLTGYENLLISCELYDIPRSQCKARINEALAFMGLADSVERLVRTYSGGMIRRLEIAQSMLHHPQVLFLDEPTVGLDPRARTQVWEHVKRLLEEFGTTIFLTTHFMEEADVLCDRVAIMNLGEVSVTGSPDELKASLGKKNASLDDVFIHYTGGQLESAGGYRDAARTRRAAKRLG